MATFVSPAAYAASHALVEQGFIIKRSHISEVIAALLGYRSYAALTAEEADTTLHYHLDDAEIIVLNQARGMERADNLGFQGSPVVAACIVALKDSAAQAQVFDGMAEFYELHARQELVETIAFDDAVAGVMGGSNAVYPGAPEIDDECPLTADLWSAIDEWRIEATGTMVGEYDLESDRMFNGDTLHCRGWLDFRKAGRAGLVFVESGAGAQEDDSWREDEDYGDLSVPADATDQL